jgi:hypothetical protein
MENIEKRLNILEKKLDLIINILNNDVKENCEKMGGHINFVEKVYDNVKNPLYYICNKINYITNGEKKELEEN